jgi:hypothetical protein
MQNTRLLLVKKLIRNKYSPGNLGARHKMRLIKYLRQLASLSLRPLQQIMFNI